MTSTRSPSTATATQLRWVLALTSTAYFMVILDTGALFTALPSMQRDLHADLASLQWTVNSYGIAFAAGIITALTDPVRSASVVAGARHFLASHCSAEARQGAYRELANHLAAPV